MESHLAGPGDPWHSIGGYAAWRQTDARAFDLLWISLAERAAPRRHRVLPTGEPSIAIRRRRDWRGALRAIDVVVCATYDRAFWYCPDPLEELIALRLKPELSAALFGVEAGAHLNTAPAPAPTPLLRRLSGAQRAAERGDDLRAVALALMADVAAIAENNDAVNAGVAAIAAEAIRGANGRINIGALAQSLSVSDRHLRRSFQDAIGCGPKAYARRARLTAAAIAADAVDCPDWAAIAADAGYHDQQHMIGEFTELAGLSPARAHAERKAQSVFSNTPIECAL